MKNTTLVKEMLTNYMSMHMDVDNVSDATLRVEGAKIRVQLKEMMGQEAFDIMIAVLHNPSCEIIEMLQD
jgi:Lhr-like helicase